MRYDKLKRGIVTLALATMLVGGIGFADNAMAQSRWERRQERIERLRERQELERIRRMDRNRQLRYQYRGVNRFVGHYDRWGRFHAYGYYDRFGRFHRI
ncbi:MAG: hypothetical protein L0226_16830 [Acidobacteria bacterium]|nr:hypothetical protein [Acidobacteriota bacterium]